MSSIVDPRHTFVEINPNVVYELSDDSLALSLGQKIHQYSRDQALVWALSDAHNQGQTIAEIRYQFQSLPSAIDADQSNQFVDHCLTSFNQAGLLSLKTITPAESPLDIREFSHFFSSRGGIYAFNQTRYQRIAYGMYFGIDVLGDQLVAFDFPHRFTSLWRETFSVAKKTRTGEGVIRCFSVSDGIIQAPQLLHSGIANNCHHLVNHNGVLFGVDTEGQRVFSIDERGNRREFPVFNPDHYHHINSLARVGDHWLLLKCITSKANTQSAFGLFDDQWNLVKDIPLPANRAHDFLPISHPEDDLSFWYCDSKDEHIRRYPDGASIHIKPHIRENSTVRGLSQTPECWVVGGGQYGRYYEYKERQNLLGSISFIDKTSLKRTSRLLVPEAPCCIIANPWYAR